MNYLGRDEVQEAFNWHASYLDAAELLTEAANETLRCEPLPRRWSRGGFKRSKQWEEDFVKFVWDEFTLVTKSAGRAAVCCPGACTGTATWRRGFNRADDDMRGAMCSHVSVARALSQLFKREERTDTLWRRLQFWKNYTNFGLKQKDVDCGKDLW